MSKEYIQQTTIRPKKKYAGLIEDLMELAEEDDRNFNDFVCLTLFKYVKSRKARKPQSKKS